MRLDDYLPRKAFFQSFFGGFASGALVLIFDKLIPNKSSRPYLSQEKISRDALDWCRDFFGDLRYYNVLPGFSNIDYFNNIHPNILLPLQRLADFYVKNGIEIKTAGYESLASLNLDNQIMLIGGPVSNTIARDWQGYTQNPVTKIYEYTGSAIKRRWRFEYNLDPNTSIKPLRFLNGFVKDSWPQSIKDETNNELKFAQVNNDGFLIQDYLLITYMANPYSRNGRDILDISDLHGVGNDAFIDIISNIDQLEILKECMVNTNVFPGDHFQALYRIFVENDYGKKETKVKNISPPLISKI